MKKEKYYSVEISECIKFEKDIQFTKQTYTKIPNEAVSTDFI